MALRVLFAASEAAPYAKTGGLADVAGALPSALAAQGVEVRTVVPRYRCVTAALRAVCDFGVPLGAVRETAVVKQDDRAASPTFFIESHRYFDRPELYGEAGSDYPDNGLRFAFFARAVLEMLPALDWVPDVIHLNDWQTGLTAAFLSALSGPVHARIATVFTVHNLAYQGLFPQALLADVGLPAEMYRPSALEFWGRVSCLKAGLVYADRITTVSPTYAREICTARHGCGLDGVLTQRARDLSGILNGADYSRWSPENDSYLDGVSYSEDDLSGKARAKERLQVEMGLPALPRVPLVAMIGRLVDQKGFDLVAAVMDELLSKELQMVVLGTGDPEYHRLLPEAARRHAGHLAVRLGFDEPLAHRIEAGADLFLMPSRYEPCGLNQVYSLRYGTVPVVHRTGGLADTVVDVDEAGDRASRRGGGGGTGFTFAPCEPAALLSAVDRSLATYADPARWRRIMKRGMACDFSWEASAREYVRLYRAARR
jgi:starch synthase